GALVQILDAGDACFAEDILHPPASTLHGRQLRRATGADGFRDLEEIFGRVLPQHLLDTLRLLAERLIPIQELVRVGSYVDLVHAAARRHLGSLLLPTL